MLRGCDFFVHFGCVCSYKQCVSRPEAGAVAGAASEVRLRKPERREMGWVPQCPDDLVAPTHRVRTVAAVVAKLDLSAFREPIQAREGVAGRDATDPELLVALWLYANIRGIGSARELARRCEESAPFRWLCGGVGVNHRLLSDFRTDHGQALDQLLTQVIASLVDKELVTVSRISQDGVRVRVSAGAGSCRREERLRQVLAESQRQVAGQGERMRQQVEQRSGRKVEQHLLDGGYLRHDDIERAHAQKVELFVPPKGARTAHNRGRELEPKAGDSEAVRAWKRRMASDQGKEFYRQRAATSETVNADLRTYRGLTQITVRGLHKARCVALWCALAYNIMHFGAALLK